jgi:hypothetical protein
MSAASRNKKEGIGSKRRRLRKKESDHMSADSGGKSSNIRSMLLNMPTKKKKEVQEADTHSHCIACRFHICI